MSIFSMIRRVVIAPGLVLTAGAAMLAFAVTSLLMASAAVSAELSPFSGAARSYIERIDSHPPSGDVDRDFAAFLVPQHLSGVELSRVEIAGGQDTTLRSIAADILAHADRNDPIASNAQPLSTEDPLRVTAIKVLAEADTRARTTFEKPLAGNIDRQFARLMGAHHQRAIDYASAELRFGRDPNLLQLARAILKGQQDQHAQMMKLLGGHAHEN